MATSHPSHSWPLSQLNRRQSSGNNTLNCISGGVQTLPNCAKLDELLIRCNDLVNRNAPKQDVVDCMCTQDMLNAYIGCKNDARLCSLSYAFDPDYDVMIADWNSACQPHFTGTRSAPTTPAAVTVTQTHDGNSCQSLLMSCNKLETTFSSCSSAFRITQSADWSSCMCRSDVLSLASECQVDGAVECLRATVDLTTLWGVMYCSVTPTIPVDAPAATITSRLGSGPSISFGPRPTTLSTTTSGGFGTTMAPVRLLAFSVFFLLLWV